MVGREVCRLLAAQGERVRGLVRPTTSNAKVADLERLGVEVVTGDVRDRSSLDRACVGARAVVSAVGNFQSQDPDNSIRAVFEEGQITLIDAAKAHGVEHFVPSTYGFRPSRVSGHIPLMDAKAAAEQHLVDSGLSYTIIYSSFFMEAWLSPMLGFDPLNARARIYGSGKKPNSWVSFKNVVETIVACISDDRFRNRAIDVAGLDAITPLEVVRIFEEEGGRKFEVEHVGEEALASMAQGASDPLQKSFALFLHEYARGYAIDMSELQAQLPVRWVSVREYARSVYDLATKPSSMVVS
jgi:NADH dehydrogenase